MYGFALVGCGSIGKRHAELIAAAGRLVAVCDVIRSRAEGFADTYGCAAYTNIDELLDKEKDVSVIVVCTPNGLHAEHAIKSLQGGRHVLCEKPLCLSMSAASSMMDTAHFFRRKLFIVKQNRYNGPVQFVKQLLDNGALGTIRSFQVTCHWNRPQAYYAGDWRGTTELDGGLLYTQFSHFIDLVYWFLGDMEKASGYRSNNGLRPHLQTEDTGVAILQMKNGALGTLHYSINAFEKNAEGSFTLIGDKGIVKIGGQYLNSIDYLHTAAGSRYVPTSAGEPNDYGFYTGSMSNHHLVYEDLIRALNGDVHRLPLVADAAKSVEIIERIYANTILI